MSKDQKPQTLTVQRIITITNSRQSMKFSVVKLYNKVITMQKTYNKDRIRLYPCDSRQIN